MRKTCSKCGEEKDLSEFKKKRGSICKKCFNERKRQFYQQNPEYREKMKMILKAWRENNKTYHKDYFKEWRKNNKEAIKIYRRTWVENNKEHFADLHERWKQEHPENYKAYYKKYYAKFKSNPERVDKIKEYLKQRFKEDKKNLTDYYVIPLLTRYSKLSTKDIRQFPELIEIKRNNIILKRVIEKKKDIDELFKQELKRCRCCGEIKSIEEFYKDNSTKYKVAYCCKHCVSQKRKQKYHD